MKNSGIPILAVTLLATGSTLAQNYPTRPIRIIVPSTPGGSVDMLARTIGARLGERWGQQVTAVIQVRPGAEVTLEQVRDHVRGRLAAYKAPRRIVVVPKVPRFPNGKADYPTCKELADKALAND